MHVCVCVFQFVYLCVCMCQCIELRTYVLVCVLELGNISICCQYRNMKFCSNSIADIRTYTPVNNITFAMFRKTLQWDT